MSKYEIDVSKASDGTRYFVTVPGGYEALNVEQQLENMYSDEEAPRLIVHLRRLPAPPAPLAVMLPRDVVEWLASEMEMAYPADSGWRKVIPAARAALAAEPAGEVDAGCLCKPCDYCIQDSNGELGWDCYQATVYGDCKRHGKYVFKAVHRHGHPAPAAEPAAECRCGPCQLFDPPTCNQPRERHGVAAGKSGHEWQGDSSACPLPEHKAVRS